MNVLRDMWVDLVDKRLWPVALILALALVAVPVVLSKDKASPPSDGAALTAANGSKSIQTAVSLSPQAVSRLRGGRIRDPFEQQGAGAPDSGTSTATGSGSAPASGSGGSSGSSSSSTGETTTPDETNGPTRRSAAAPTRIRVRFGPADAARQLFTIESLVALPDTRNPIVVFLGLKADRRTARFLVSSDAIATGDGKCIPDGVQCVEVHLRARQTENFDVSDGNGGVVRYRLDVLRINPGKDRKSGNRQTNPARNKVGWRKPATTGPIAARRSAGPGPPLRIP